MKVAHNLILIGYRGTGKTSVARVLAQRLGWTWIDADTYLEHNYGRTIRAIFEQEGEAGFRDKEAAVLAELLAADQQVVATGGGVILRKENRARLREAGTVVWLTADAATIWARLQTDQAPPERRPPLTPRGGLDEIRELLARREPLYQECAEITVDTVGRSPEEVADLVLKQSGLLFGE